MHTAIKHFVNLLLRSWHAMTNATGTTTLGFLVWTIAIAIVAWMVSVVAKLIELRKQRGERPFQRAVSASLLSAGLSFGSIFTVVVFVWAGFVILTVYDDHQALVKRNQELLGKGNGNPYAIFANNQYASTINTFMAFAWLENLNTQPEDKNACHLRITAPSENVQVAQVLSSIARAAHCFVESPDPFMIDHSAPVSETVLIHVPQNRKERLGFATAMSNAFNVKTSTDLPAESQQNLIWVQIGSGNVWRQR
jgi:hypothetical protein